MKVCFLSYSTCTHALNWAGRLLEQGIEVHYISLEEVYVPEGIIFHRIKPLYPNCYMKFVLNAWKVKRILKRINPDLLHAFYVTNYALLAVLSGFAPVFVTVQGSDLLLEPNKSIFFKWVNRFVLNRVSIVHSVANHMVAKLIDYGVPLEKIVIFPEGVDIHKFLSNSHSIKSKTIDGVNVISTRNLQPVYNLCVLVEAIPYIMEKFSSVRFNLVGEGPERDKLSQKASTLGVDKYIKFTGKIPKSQMVDYLSSSDVYVTTSLSDGTSASLLEAMSCGVFPVVSDIPANREWIEDGFNGLLFPVDDPVKLAEAILRAIEDSQLRKAGNKRNKEIIDRMGDVGKIVHELIQIYEKLVAEGG